MLALAAPACGSGSSASENPDAGPPANPDAGRPPPQGVAVTVVTADWQGKPAGGKNFILIDASGESRSFTTQADGTLNVPLVRTPYDLVAVDGELRTAFIGVTQTSPYLALYQPAPQGTASPGAAPAPQKHSADTMVDMVAPQCGTPYCVGSVTWWTSDPNPGQGNLNGTGYTQGNTSRVTLTHKWTGPSKSVSATAHVLISDSNYSHYWYSYIGLSFSEESPPSVQRIEPTPIQTLSRFTIKVLPQGIPDTWEKGGYAILGYPEGQSIRFADLTAATSVVGVPNIAGATLGADFTYRYPERQTNPHYDEMAWTVQGSYPLLTESVELPITRAPLFSYPAKHAHITASTDWKWQHFSATPALLHLIVYSVSEKRAMHIYTQQTSLSPERLQLLGMKLSPGEYSLSAQVSYPTRSADEVLAREKNEKGAQLWWGDTHANADYAFTVDP